ncbi:MAG: STAS/SEC14 domain-containing protein [Flavobacteriales bacterium]|nr:STAS/SEC14 domain-containing protein [Flavobacteriales bacterium]
MESDREEKDAALRRVAHCEFRFHAPRVLIQRFLPSARFEQPYLDLVASLRDELFGNSACALLVTIPAAVPVNPEATNVDHFRSERERRRILALAIVAEGDTMRAVVKFYFSWFPQAFPARVFDDEAEAIVWLQKLVAADGGLS